MPNPDRYHLPVYNPNTGGSQPEEHDRVVALHHEETNIRVILDEDPKGPNDGDEPNILIERHKNLWLVIIHPHGGDPTCSVKLHDNGLSQVEDCGGALLYEEQSFEP